MMVDDGLARAATDEMTQICQALYDREGHVDTMLTAYGRSPARQIVALIDDHVHIPVLARYLIMALAAAALTFVAEAAVKEWVGDDVPLLLPGDLVRRAEYDSTIETQVIVTTMGIDQPGFWTVRSTPRLDDHGQRVWHTVAGLDGDSLIYTYLAYAAARPMPGGPLPVDDLDRFVDELMAQGLTPLARVVDPGG